MFHGTGGSPTHFWFPYLIQSLSKDEFAVTAPQLPNTDNPNIAEWLPFALKTCVFDKDTILVGHSAGCPLILSILENIDTQINKAILVAGFSQPLGKEPEPILQDQYNWSKIKQNSKYFAFINSVNDPWGCNDLQGRIIFDKLGGDLIIRSDQGHMGSESFNQPYAEFPLVKSLIENKVQQLK